MRKVTFSNPEIGRAMTTQTDGVLWGGTHTDLEVFKEQSQLLREKVLNEQKKPTRRVARAVRKGLGGLLGALPPPAKPEVTIEFEQSLVTIRLPISSMRKKSFSLYAEEHNAELDGGAADRSRSRSSGSVIARQPNTFHGLPHRLV